MRKRRCIGIVVPVCMQTFCDITEPAHDTMTLMESLTMQLRMITPFELVFVALTGYAFSLLSMHFGGPKAPLVGLSSVFETRYSANWRFFRDAASVLDKGYGQVRHDLGLYESI